ncbi:MAG TPA: tRNA (adenosine(37)-N6)-threonylcarbamoyltransferase complex transferase subunit TsaD [Tepidisphaeraceae bacterium]|jgi:N6-L-threonylcarbamoyladenine synthase
MPTILGIESTCDETAASVVTDGRAVRSNVVATQYELHQAYRGVVPEIASRAHIENILPVIAQALKDAAVALGDVDAIAVAQRPGLIGSLLVGLTAAKSLAWSLGKPLIAVDHVQAHLYSVLLDTDATPPLPAIGLVCSGGHTALYLVRSWTDAAVIGRTRDDAVGEAYDKVATILNLPYPGGPIVDERAARGRPTIRFPRPQLQGDDLDFSFSGLKTSVLYHVRGHQGRERDAGLLSESQVDDVCASFQAACIDVLIEKLRRALNKHQARSVILGGGVSANRGLRAAMSKLNVETFVPRLQFCTDNAAMIAGLGDLLLRDGACAALDIDAVTQSSLRAYASP